MKLTYRHHSQFNKLETTATATADRHGLELKHASGRVDKLSLLSCHWVPLSRIWPLSWVGLITFAGIIAVGYLAAGLWLHAVAPLAMVAVLLFKFPASVMRHGLLVSDHLVIIPETREEAGLFSGCPNLSITGTLRRAWEKR